MVPDICYSESLPTDLRRKMREVVYEEGADQEAGYPGLLSENKTFENRRHQGALDCKEKTAGTHTGREKKQ